MSLQSDTYITLKKQSAFGTPATPDTSYPFTDEDLEYVPTWTQGIGQHTGQRTPSAATYVKTKEEVGGSFTIEASTKGMGKLFEAALGVGVSNQISGAAYQQLFTQIFSDFLPCYTIQKNVPLLGGAIQPHTFTDMVCGGFEISAPNGGIPTIKFNWVGSALDTATSAAAATYPAGVKLHSFVGGSIRSGSITVPTTTALASGGDALANIRSFDLTYDNGLDTEGFNFGANGQRARKPAVGNGGITGSLEAEYDSNALRDAWIAGTDLALVLKFQTGAAIAGANYPTLEITIPLVRLGGELPKAVKQGVITQTIPFTGLDGLVAASAIYVAIVTAETAI